MFKEYYYYCRDEENTPVITVCLLENLETGEIGKGITIRSINDQAVKKIGRKIAFKRAMKAHLSRMTQLPILREEATLETEEEYKSIFNPVLTDFERMLMRKNE